MKHRFKRGILKMFWANVSTAKHRVFQGDQIWRGPHALEGNYVSSGVFNKNDFPSVFILPTMFGNFFI